MIIRSLLTKNRSCAIQSRQTAHWRFIAHNVAFTSSNRRMSNAHHVMLAVPSDSSEKWNREVGVRELNLSLRGIGVLICQGYLFHGRGETVTDKLFWKTRKYKFFSAIVLSQTSSSTKLRRYNAKRTITQPRYFYQQKVSADCFLLEKVDLPRACEGSGDKLNRWIRKKYGGHRLTNLHSQELDRIVVTTRLHLGSKP